LLSCVQVLQRSISNPRMAKAQAPLVERGEPLPSPTASDEEDVPLPPNGLVRQISNPLMEREEPLPLLAVSGVSFFPWKWFGFVLYSGSCLQWFDCCVQVLQRSISNPAMQRTVAIIHNRDSGPQPHHQSQHLYGAFPTLPLANFDKVQRVDQWQSRKSKSSFDVVGRE
jgi:hypothetical protein